MFNKTQLYIDRAEDRGIVHRDYLAHCMRWTHILRYAKMGMKILDVGCGINTPLAMTFYTNRYKPEYYVGLDLRHDIKPPVEFNFPHNFCAGFDITDEAQWEAMDLFVGWDLVACLEVIEHMEKSNGIKLLQNLSLLPAKSIIFLSTPCFNGSKAANHIYEWRYDELRDELQKYFKIEAHYGTFASQTDILSSLSEEEKILFRKLREYYDSNVLSILFAPLHPSRSRNCIWRLRTI